MTSLITSKAPNLPYATVSYDSRYQDQFTNILRLYFNTIDNALAEIIRILNYTGPFDTVYANTVQANTVNANTGNITTLNSSVGNINTANINTATIQVANLVNALIGIANINALTANTGSITDLSSTNITSNTVTSGTVDANYVNTLNLAATFAVLQQLQANTVSAANFQGGNAVFNNLTTSVANASLFTGSGRELNFPHIGASGNADQYATADNTPTIVQWDTADEARGFTLNLDYTATATYDGVYKITYGLQFANTDNAPHDVLIWLRVNGTDVTKSAVKFTLPARKSAGVPSFLLAGSSIVFNINAGQSVGLWWATEKAYSTTGPVDGVYIEYLPAQTVPYAHPAVPASIGSIVYISAPDPARTRVVPIGVLSYGGTTTPSFAVNISVSGSSASGSVGVPTVVIT